MTDGSERRPRRCEVSLGTVIDWAFMSSLLQSRLALLNSAGAFLVRPCTVTVYVPFWLMVLLARLAVEADGGWITSLIGWATKEGCKGKSSGTVEGTYAGAAVKHSQLQKRLYIERRTPEVADRWPLRVLPPRVP